MDTILEQKRKGQAQFRIQIDQFLSDSIFCNESDQLSLEVINQLFSWLPKQGLQNNGKINTQKLIQSIYETGSHFNTKDFMKIFNNKKEIKTQDILSVLKGHSLTSFNLQQEIAKNFFEDDKFSLKRLDKTMKQFGLNQLNKKDKQILIQCFDYNKDSKITKQDLSSLTQTTKSLRQSKNMKNKIIEKKQNDSVNVGEKITEKNIPSKNVSMRESRYKKQ